MYVTAVNSELCGSSVECPSPSLQSLSVRVCELTVMLEEKLLFSLVQWAGEGLASTDKSAGNEGREAFEMLTRRYGGGWGHLHVGWWKGYLWVWW